MNFRQIALITQKFVKMPIILYDCFVFTKFLLSEKHYSIQEDKTM